MKNGTRNEKLNFRLKIVALLLFIVLACFFVPRIFSGLAGFQVDAQSKTKTRPAKASPTPETNYDSFNHQTHLGLKLACDSCHKVPTANWDKVRTKDTAFPDVTDYPKHESCISCHREQFFSGKPPTICANCHTNPSPDDSSRHPFANPRELFDQSPKGRKAVSEFQVHFSHEKHVDLVSRNRSPGTPLWNDVAFVRVTGRRAAEESCKVCHQTYKPQENSDVEYLTPPPKDLGDAFWLKKGTFKTSPIGHTTCFTCHSADTGITPAPTDCATCHQARQPLPAADFEAKLAEKMAINDKIIVESWRRRDGSGTFRHEFSSHADLSCATCHNVNQINTQDFKSKKVAVASCAPCHITATSDDGGILNYEIDSRKKDAKFECVKCHLTFGRLPIPDSHLKAVTDAGK
jgi:hypothetical protein